VIAALDVVRSIVDVEPVVDIPAVRMYTEPDFETAVFPFTTDVPLLTNWGKPLLFGPGSIHVAHTTEEFIDEAELRASVDAYVKLVSQLLTTR
jgi:acetylornithine deacetylase